MLLVATATAAGMVATPAPEPGAARAAASAGGEEVELSLAGTGRWNLDLLPYLWAPNIHAKTAAGKLDLSISDVVDDLDFAVMFALIADKDGSPWGFTADAFYLDLEDGPLEHRATGLTGCATYRLFEDRPHKVFVGARYWDLYLRAGAIGASDDWIDPLIGASSAHHFNESCWVNVLVDAGGFGVGDASDFTCQGLLALHYRVNDSINIGAGYRYMHVDQEEETEFDADIHGPILGLRITL